MATDVVVVVVVVVVVFFGAKDTHANILMSESVSRANYVHEWACRNSQCTHEGSN